MAQTDMNPQEVAAAPEKSRRVKASRPKEPRPQLTGVQFMFAAILAIGMALGVTLSSRIAASQPLQEFYESVETEIADLRLEQSALIVERDYAMDDAYVEQWARAEGKLYRPGEVIVVPVPYRVLDENVQPTPTPIMNVDTTPPDPEPWKLWWALFFDSPPPSF